MICLIHFHPQIGNDRTDTVDDKQRPSSERLIIGGGLIGKNIDGMHPAADTFNLDNLQNSNLQPATMARLVVREPPCILKMP